MKSFIFWLVLDSIVSVQLVCAFNDVLLPVNLFVAILLALLSIILLLFSIIRKNKKQASFTAAIIASLIIGFCTLKYQENSRMNDANRLIQAIDRYKLSNNKYPASLAQLVPSQLTSVPKNNFGFISREFIYLATKNYYSLKVEMSKSSGIVWLSNERVWAK